MPQTARSPENADWDTARAKLADTEAHMVAVLDDLELTELACSMQGLSPVGAAAILAETGDLRRFTSSRAVVKHAGLAANACPAPSPDAPA
jgi:transposase